MPSQPVPAAEFLLEHMSRTLWDPVDPASLGSLERRLHAKVNGEIYRFSRPATLARFRRNPARWCGILRDPVSGARFVPTSRSPRWDHGDIPYFFTGDSTRRVFMAAPDRWAIRRDY